MSVAAITVIGTVIGVVGTALFAMFFMQFQNLREDIRAQGGRIDQVIFVLRDHGERLTRIEAKLENNPPAEAA